MRGGRGRREGRLPPSREYGRAVRGARYRPRRGLAGVRKSAARRTVEAPGPPSSSPRGGPRLNLLPGQSGPALPAAGARSQAKH